jgi:hypothetical protein
MKRLISLTAFLAIGTLSLPAIAANSNTGVSRVEIPTQTPLKDGAIRLLFCSIFNCSKAAE